MVSMGYTALNKGVSLRVVCSNQVNIQVYGNRIGCDLMNLFLLFDDSSDVLEEHKTCQQADTIINALQNPHKPQPTGECVGGEVGQQ
jgi:hypothetical protein